MNIQLLRGAIISRFDSQKVFAEKIQWPENKLSRMMQKKYVPDIHEVAIIAGELHLSDEMFRQIFLS